MQDMSQDSVWTGSVAVSMKGAAPANFTARGVVVRGGQFVSAFATALFEVHDEEMDRLVDDVISSLQAAGSSSAFAGVAEAAVVACTCRDAASTDVAVVPLSPDALSTKSRVCSLHVDGLPAADVVISPDALVSGIDSAGPSLAVQVRRQAFLASPFKMSVSILLIFLSQLFRDLKISTQGLTFCGSFVTVHMWELLHFGSRPRPSFARNIIQAPASILFTSLFCNARPQTA
jgi:hypothetical protein